MSNENTPGYEQASLVGRLTSGLANRRFGFFFAELVLVIVGVLGALAVDGWISDARDRRTETTYLELLARDIEGIRNQGNLQIEFEKERIVAAAKVYAALSVPDPSTKYEEVGPDLALLIARRTLRLTSATYDQMVSSGHLQLIRNHELRNNIVRFFDEMDRNERIIDNNNRELVDDVFTPFIMRAGITGLKPARTLEATDTLNRANALVYESLGETFVPPVDRVLQAPADADSWNDIRRNVLFRMRIAATGQALAERALEHTADIQDEIAAELDGR